MDLKMTTNDPSPQTFNNNDVLLLSPVNDSAEDELVRFASSAHIGNRRFEIFLNIYRQQYKLALDRSDKDTQECIAMIIADTICNRCKPRGRFFVKVSNNDGWDELGFGGDTLDYIKRALLHHPVVFNSVNKGGNADGTEDTKTSTGVVGLHCFDRMVPPKNNGKKRCRKSSYLCPSSIEDFGFKRPCHHESLILNYSNEQRKHISNNDVLCAVDEASDKYVLHPTEHSVGNNRLRVMMHLRRDKYLGTTSKEEQFQIASEIVSIVRNEMEMRDSGISPPGRFLVEDICTGYWREMSRKRAVEAVMAGMKKRTKQDISNPQTAALQCLKDKIRKKDSESRMRQEYVDEIQRKYRVKCSESPRKSFANASA
uniref:DUF6824 domain-containing protein n=1 Tax=Ditylum brightwellii TaxID=49249 RepID=A0A6V2NFY2_9STRA|mmetsp:Transcript_36345/g.48728  ORF Transcript_36345/g.48728 Transcript_36345/m.48728 type:complete len:370 (+) Transcript_36345:136-1245(+)